MTTAFEIYQARLGQLNQLIRDGKGEGALADCLRERMDSSWYLLTEEEMAQVRKEFKQDRQK